MYKIHGFIRHYTKIEKVLLQDILINKVKINIKYYFIKQTNYKKYKLFRQDSSINPDN